VKDKRYESNTRNKVYILSQSTEMVRGLTCIQEVPFLRLDRGHGRWVSNDTLPSIHVA
jgi:hypothetical protein